LTPAFYPYNPRNQKGYPVDLNDKQRCKCGHDLDLHGPRGCTAGNGKVRQCWCSRSQSGALALLAPPEPEPVSLQHVGEPDVDALLNKFWVIQERHLAEHEEQMRILNERRTQSGKNS
jgi:hypothetical protein